ncbi:hypothetical protein GCM10028819_13240 [Spirosoma humi]
MLVTVLVIMVLVLITAMDTGPMGITAPRLLFAHPLWLGLGITPPPPVIMAVALVVATMAVEVAVTAEVVVRADQDNPGTLY